MSAVQTWIEVDQTSDFSVYNIPFGIASIHGKSGQVVSRLGDHIISLSSIAEQGWFDGISVDVSVFYESILNPFIRQGKEVTSAVRKRIQTILTDDAFTDKADLFLFPVDQAQMMMPLHVGDYTDFYSSEDHARNVGKMFRDPENALLPNWKHLPVGYHGRANTIVPSGTPIIRPTGQSTPGEDGRPGFGPCRLLDFELEMGMVIGKDTDMGQRVSTDEAADYIFGIVLFNDWSARDIQKWEYVPLGPFLGKNFASTISPWIISLDAIAPFKVDGPHQEPEVLPYLKYSGQHNYDIHLEVWLKTAEGAEKKISTSNYKYMYWNMAQQLAHHTVNGCAISVGDIYASGTISGPTDDSLGSLLEISWKGTRPILFEDGTERKFLQDGDSLILKGWGQGDGYRVGLGICEGTIVAGGD